MADENIQKQFEKEFKAICEKIPAMFIDGRANLNSENFKLLCEGFFKCGVTHGIQIGIDKLKK